MTNDSDYGLSLNDNDDVAVITFHCGRGHRIRAPRSLAGHKGKCSKCGEPVRIPDISHPAPWMRFAAWFIKALRILKGVESSGDELARKTDRIKALTLDQAKSLVEHKGDLYLDGLTAISDNVAKALAAHEGGLYLGGLTTLDVDTAKTLAEFKGNRLALRGLTTLDAVTAKALVGSTAWDGQLPNLTTLDAATAKALAEFEGHGLGLEGLAARGRSRFSCP
jgi:hypothetical protein